MDNLELYNRVRVVPPEAQKSINAGRLKGMTDINPMWRIKKLTEEFGMCGVGWYFSDVSFTANDCGGEIVVTCTGILHTKSGSEWNAPVFGVGGSKLVTKESKGLYVDDEAYKKAYTDMMSVACKALGVGADVYWSKDRSKYGDLNGNNAEKINEHGVKTLNNLMYERQKADKQQTNRFYCELQKKYSFNDFTEVTSDKYNAILDDITRWWPQS